MRMNVGRKGPCSEGEIAGRGSSDIERYENMCRVNGLAI